MVIAIDFDGTIVEEIYPSIGGLIPNAKKIINQLHNDGHIIIINSCRSGKYEGDAENFLIANGIHFDYINSNLPYLIEKYGRDCRKISADIYIDDKNLGGLPEWDEIYEEILNEVDKRAVVEST